MATPTNLIGIESVVELLSLLATFAIGYTAYNIYKLTSEKKYLYFSMGFIFLTLGFLIRSFINAGVYFGRRDVVEIAISAPIITIYTALSIAYLMLVISAYLILIIVTFKIQDAKLIPLFAIFALVSVVASHNFYIVFPVLSFLLLGYLVTYYYSSYKKKKKKNQLVIAIGFFVITIAQIFFPLINRAPEWFVAGTAVQLLGYIILLSSLIMVLRK